jgi:hypothetical protein
MANVLASKDKAVYNFFFNKMKTGFCYHDRYSLFKCNILGGGSD